MSEIAIFLLGFPLSIVSNFTTIFLQNVFTENDVKPLKSIFIKSFLGSLNENKKRVDEIGRCQIEMVQQAIIKDENLIFKIISEAVGTKPFDILILRDASFQNLVCEKMLSSFNLSYISLAKNVLVDCLRNYEEQFYLNMSNMDGIHIILNLLRKIDSENAKKSDIINLHQTILSEFEKTKIPSKTSTLLKGEIVNPESRFFSDEITTYFNSIRKTIKNLTNDQYQVLHYLRYKSRVIISGCAGSGKTLLAVEKALRLDSNGIKSLILTHNPNLAQYIRKLVLNTTIEVDDFTSFIYRITNNTTSKIEIWNEYIEPTEDELYNALEVIIRDKIAYESIIIDEGQDFRELWWTLIEEMSNNSNSKILYLFYDDNQLLLPFKTKYPLNESPYVISKNCRNSGNIFEVVKKFHNNAPITSAFLKEKGILKVSTFNDKDYLTILSECLKDCLKKFEKNNISILTNEPSTSKSILNGFKTNKSNLLNWTYTVLDDLKKIQKHVFKKINSYEDFINDTELLSKYDIPFETNLEEYFQVPILSEELAPTKEDIKNVAKFARKSILFFPNNYSDILKFQTDSGAIVLNNSYGNVGDLASKVNFYKDTNWHHTLPNIKPLILKDDKEASDDENTILLKNIDSFKGLESECLILFINTINRDISKELYIGTSRAISYLHIIINSKVYHKVSQLRDI